jgi:hypothetical protein
MVIIDYTFAMKIVFSRAVLKPIYSMNQSMSLSVTNIYNYVITRKLLDSVLDTLLVFISLWEIQIHWASTSFTRQQWVMCG